MQLPDKFSVCIAQVKTQNENGTVTSMTHYHSQLSSLTFVRIVKSVLCHTEQVYKCFVIGIIYNLNAV